LPPDQFLPQHLADFLSSQGEEQAQDRGKVLFDVGYDHVAQPSLPADALHLVVEGAEGHQDFRASVG